MPCCGAGAESRGPEIKLPPGARAGAGAKITNCGSYSFLFITDMKKLYRKKPWSLKFWQFIQVFNFNPISQVNKARFSR
jgi:hypothetical protein